MLPSYENLARRKVPVGVLCPMCKCKCESILYGLWSCSCLKMVRDFRFPKLAGNRKNKFHFFEFILDCFTRLNLEDLGLLCVCLWKSWSLRNAVVHNVVCDRAVNIVEWAVCFVNEYQGVNNATASRGVVSSH